MLLKRFAEMAAGDHYDIRIQWKNAFHKSAQVGGTRFGWPEFINGNGKA